MIAAAILTMAISALIALIAPRLADPLPPRTATVLLVGAGLASALSCAFAFGAFAFTWIAQIPPVAREGDWSPPLLRGANPVPLAAAVLGGVAVAAGAAGVTRVAVRQVQAYRQLRGLLRGLHHTDGLIVVEAARPVAYATLAAGGRMVVTTGMLAALGDTERRVVIAHERAHLRFRHSWWTTAADIAAALNPLLRPIARAVGDSVERWADEQAAADVGDRRLTARALARAALSAHANAHPSAALGTVGGQMPRRVNALLAPTPRLRPAPLVALLGLLVAVTLATAAMGTTADAMFDQATVTTTK